jgi:hypothetical protein
MKPMALRCVRCRAPHGSVVYRLKSNPEFYMPGPERPWCPELYEAKSEKIDLMLSDKCARCSSVPAPVQRATKPQQTKLFG